MSVAFLSKTDKIIKKQFFAKFEKFTVVSNIVEHIPSPHKDILKVSFRF